MELIFALRFPPHKKTTHDSSLYYNNTIVKTPRIEAAIIVWNVYASLQQEKILHASMRFSFVFVYNTL